jgi:hypothetical protein
VMIALLPPDRIAVRFPYDASLIACRSAIPGYRRDSAGRCRPHPFTQCGMFLPRIFLNRAQICGTSRGCRVIPAQRRRRSALMWATGTLG